MRGLIEKLPRDADGKLHEMVDAGHDAGLALSVISFRHYFSIFRSAAVCACAVSRVCKCISLA